MKRLLVLAIFLAGCAQVSTPYPTPQPIPTMIPVVTPEPITPQPVALDCPDAVEIEAHQVCLVEVQIETPEFWPDGSPTGFTYRPDVKDGKITELLAIDMTASVGSRCIIWQTANRYVLCETVRAVE